MLGLLKHFCDLKNNYVMKAVNMLAFSETRFNRSLKKLQHIYIYIYDRPYHGIAVYHKSAIYFENMNYFWMKIVVGNLKIINIDMLLCFV